MHTGQQVPSSKQPSYGHLRGHFISSQSHNKNLQSIVNIQVGGDPVATHFVKVNRPDSNTTITREAR